MLDIRKKHEYRKVVFDYFVVSNICYNYFFYCIKDVVNHIISWKG